MFLTNHSSAFLLHDVRVVKNVACMLKLPIKSQLDDKSFTYRRKSNGPRIDPCGAPQMTEE